MTKGALRWNDRKCHKKQNNNPTEEFIRKLKIELEKYGNTKTLRRLYSLQSCGPTAALNCLAVLGHDVIIKCPGIYEPQPEEVLMDFFNDTHNDNDLEKLIPGVNESNIPENRYAALYPFAVKQVFNVLFAEYRKIRDFYKIADLLAEGNSVQLLLDSPSHYIAAVAYDYDKDEIIYNDPHIKRRSLRNGGFNERMTKPEYDSNVTKRVVVYKAV